MGSGSKKGKKEQEAAAGEAAAEGKKRDKDKEKPKPEEKKAPVIKPGEENLRYIVRIAGTDLPGTKGLRTAICRIRGVSFNFATICLNVLGLDPRKKVGALTDEEIAKMEDFFKNPAGYKIPTFIYNRRKDVETGEDKHLLGADWEFQVKQDIDKAKKLKSYVGIRHFYGLKLRGQRTGSRGANQRGRSGKTVGVIRDKIAAAAKAASDQEKEKGTAASGGKEKESKK